MTDQCDGLWSLISGLGRLRTGLSTGGAQCLWSDAPEERLKGLGAEEGLKGLDPATIEAWLAKQRRGH